MRWLLSVSRFVTCILLAAVLIYSGLATVRVDAISNTGPDTSDFASARAYYTLSNTRDVAYSASMGISIFKSGTAPKDPIQIIVEYQGGSASSTNLQAAQGIGVATFDKESCPNSTSSRGAKCLIIKPSDWGPKADGAAVRIIAQLADQSRSVNDDSNHVNFKLKAPKGYVIAPDGGYNIAVVQSTPCSPNKNGICGIYQNYSLPFAPACDVKGTGSTNVEIYDMDNDQTGIQPEKASIQIIDKTDNKVVNNNNRTGGGEGNGQTAYFGFTWVAEHKYELKINHVYDNNVLQMKLPFDSINASTNCVDTCSYLTIPQTEPNQPFDVSLRVPYFSALAASNAVKNTQYSVSVAGTTVIATDVRIDDPNNVVTAKARISSSGSQTGKFTDVSMSTTDVPAITATGCKRQVVIKPYINVSIGDVFAGAPVPLSTGGCTPAASAGVASWNKRAAPYAGAGSSYGATASDKIIGFASAQGSSQSGIGLSFANTTNNAPASDNFGGNFGNFNLCLSDYTLPNKRILKLSNQIDAQYGVTGHRTEYFNGNVYIKGNQIFQEGWSNLRDIPSLAIIAVGGNIYIDSSVTRLDGTYIAQPSSTGGGTIYTCANGLSSISVTSANYIRDCGNQLVVNGSLIAKSIDFKRTCGTLAEAISPEPKITTGTCDQNHAAEVINNGPADWLGRSNTPSGQSAQWDSVVSLPPVL